MQIEEWIADMEANSSDKRTGRTISHSLVALKRHYHQLKEELAKMKPPTDLDGTDEDKEMMDAESVQNPAIPTPLKEDPADAHPGGMPSTSHNPNNTSNSNNVATEAAEVLASSTVEYALNAAVQSVLHHSGALDSTDTSPDSVVSADSASGLVYVEEQMDTESSKTDAEKTQEEMNEELFKYL